VQGSGGEAVHLTRNERIEVIKAVRSAVEQDGFKNYPIIAGTGAQSLHETLLLTQDVNLILLFILKSKRLQMLVRIMLLYCHQVITVAL
jgi:hypothetical protein